MPLLFDLDKDPEERFSYLREQPDVAARLMARVGEMRAEVETLHKQAGNPFAPKDPSIPVGPVLSPDVRAHK